MMSELKTNKYPELNFNVVLINPQIPNNTGNIGRLCVGSWSRLHLVHPLGFEIDDKRVKRAGLDYWPELDLVQHESIASWKGQLDKGAKIYLFSSHGEKTLYDLELKKGDALVFGREADGLPESLLKEFAGQVVRIPFPGRLRSFNLSNAVAMTLGEGLRQLAFKAL